MAGTELMDLVGVVVGIEALAVAVAFLTELLCNTFASAYQNLKVYFALVMALVVVGILCLFGVFPVKTAYNIASAAGVVFVIWKQSTGWADTIGLFIVSKIFKQPAPPPPVTPS